MTAAAATMRVGVVLLACVLLAGCSSSSGGSSGSSPAASRPSASATVPSSSPAAPSSAPSGMDEVPKCVSLVDDPDWAKKLGDGLCMTASGDYVTTGSFDCKDGSKLYQFDADGVSYWGKSTGRLMKSADIDKDAGYRKAYTACTRG